MTNCFVIADFKNIKNKKMPTENKIRITALLVFILTLLFIFTNSVFIPLFLLIDFSLRGFGFGKWSLLGLLAERLVKIFRLQEKPIYFPPKQFAAQVGFIFSATLLVLNISNLNTHPISFILLICAGLEAFFNFCVGCWVFSYYSKIKNRP